jgi:3-oxoacyl-[acyl-carrier protein] reductase
MDLRLKNKKALILASTKGLGRAAAEGLAQEGATVIVSSSNQQRSSSTASELSASTGARVIGIAADMFLEADIDALYEKCVSAVGGIDILVINHPGPVLGLASKVAVDVLHEQFRMMVANPIKLIRHVLPAMRANKWGRIISVSGGGVVQPLPNKVMDNTLRPAIVGYTKALANEVAADSVTVNIILPGTFITDRVHDSTASNAKLWGISIEETMKRRIESIPAARFGELKEFAAVVTFMASEQSSYMTGSIVRVDGSQTRSIL